MTKALITGCEGFVGSHLADLLVEKGNEVYGMVYGDTTNIDHLKGRIKVLKADLRDRKSVEAVVEQSRPDVVYHLAAQSFLVVSWEQPEVTLETNVLGSFYLLEALRTRTPSATVLVVGSSSVYGPCTPEEMPMREDREFRPSSAYAVSKVAEEMLGHFFWKARGMKAIRVRPFNMTGPRKTGDACSDFAQGMVEIEKGKRKSLQVGTLDTVRDFTDGRDAVTGLYVLGQRGVPGQAYNLCSGKGYTMQEVLDRLMAIAGRKITIEVIKEKIRPFDDPINIGDNSKLRALGWKPAVSFDQTLGDMLAWWRKALA